MEIPPVIDVEDNVDPPLGSEQCGDCELPSTSNDNEIVVTENEPVEPLPGPSVAATSETGVCKPRMRLRNLSPKNFGRYQLEYAHWLHTSGYRVAKRRRRHIPKRSSVGPSERRRIDVSLARQRRPMEVSLARRRPIVMRPTKLLRLDSSDRPAIKSAGPTVSKAPVSMLKRLPRNVVDVKTVDAAVSASDDRGVSDGVRAAIQMHFGAMARIKAGAKCRIMARRWTTDDQLEYLVQWDSGIVT